MSLPRPKILCSCKKVKGGVREADSASPSEERRSYAGARAQGTARCSTFFRDTLVF
jgi:hypothetical protein